MPKGSVGIEFLNLNSPEWRAGVKDDVKFFIDSWAVAEKVAIGSSDRITKAQKKDQDAHVKDFLRSEAEKDKARQKFYDEEGKRSAKLEADSQKRRAKELSDLKKDITERSTAKQRAADDEAKAAERSSLAQQKAAERTAAVQIKEHQRAQAAIAQLIERTRAAQQKALENAARGSKTPGYSIFSGVTIGGQSKDDAIKAAIASRTKYEQELEGKKVREIEKLIAGLRKEYDINQRAMQKSSDDRVKAELKADMQAVQEKIKIAQSLRNRLEGSEGKSLFGAVKGAGSEVRSGFAYAGGVVGVDLTVAGLLHLGQEAAKAEIQLRAAYKTAGASAQDASIFVRQATLDYQKYGQAIGITEQNYRQLSKEAAIAGGFLGEQNKQLVIAAAAIQKETAGGEGEITADRFIRGISTGFNSEEGSNVIGQLRRSMPLLAADLAQATDKEDLFKRAINFTNESVKSQIDWLNSEDGALERNMIKEQNNIERAGILMNKWLGSTLNFAAQVDLALDQMFGTLDAKDAEERILLEKKLADIEKAKANTPKSDTGALIEYDNIIKKLKEQITEADKSKAAIDAHHDSLQKEKQVASAAAAEIGVLADEYNNLKAAIAKLDTGRTRVEFLKDQAAVEEQKLATGQGNVWTKYFLAQTDQQIATEGKVLEQYNSLRKKHSAFDPSEEHTDTRKTTFEAEKKRLEDQMKFLQTQAELNGIMLNKTKEQIEIANLRIEIEYSYKIAQAAKKNAQLKNEYLLKAAQDEERIRIINDEVTKKEEEKRDKKFDIDFRLQLAVADKYNKERLELTKKFNDDAEGLTKEQMDQLLKIYIDGMKAINDAEETEKLKGQNEIDKKMLEAQLKGIELRQKYSKKDVSDEITLENLRYAKAEELRTLNYKEEIRSATQKGLDTEAIELENQTDRINNLNEHQDRLQKIAADANAQFKELAKQTSESAFDPIVQSMNQAIATMPKFVQTLISGLQKIAATKLATAIVDKIFPNKGSNATAEDLKRMDIADETVTHSNIPFDLPEFEEGGYTGDGSGAFLAKLHRGEIVLPPDIVSMIKGESVSVRDPNFFGGMIDHPAVAGEPLKPASEGFKKRSADITAARKQGRKLQADFDEATAGDTSQNLTDQNLDTAKYGVVEIRALNRTAEGLAKTVEWAGNISANAFGASMRPSLNPLNGPLSGKFTSLIPDISTGDSSLDQFADWQGLAQGTGLDLMAGSALIPHSLHSFGHLAHGAKFGLEAAATAGLLGSSEAGHAETTLSEDSKDATKQGTKEGLIDAAKILQGASRGKNGNVAAGIVGAGEAALNIAVPGLGSVLGALGGIFGFKDGGDYDPTKPRLVGEEGPEIDYMGTIIPLGKRKAQSNLSSHLADLAGRSAYSGGSSAQANGNAVLREMQNNTRAVKELHGAIRDGSVTTRMVQLGNHQDSIRHSTSQY